MNKILGCICMLIMQFKCLGNLNCPSSEQLSQFNPYISLMSPLTIYQPSFKINKGEFDLSERLLNWGFEFGNTFELKKDIFIRIGFKYINQQHRISAKNMVDYWLDTPHPLSWVRNFNAMTIPLVIGRKWNIKNQRTIDGYIGGSAGLMQLGQHKRSDNIEVFDGSNPFDDNIVSDVNVESKVFPLYYLMTMDFGANIQPFRRWQQLTVGVFANIQLNKLNKAYRYVGYQNDVIRNIKYDFDISYQLGRNYHLGFKLNYIF